MGDEGRQEERRVYQIRVRGHLGQDWSAWFDGLTVTVEGEDSSAPVTALNGVVADQSALRGILSAIWDLGLTLISVNPIPGEPEGEEP